MPIGNGVPVPFIYSELDISLKYRFYAASLLSHHISCTLSHQETIK